MIDPNDYYILSKEEFYKNEKILEELINEFPFISIMTMEDFRDEPPNYYEKYLILVKQKIKKLKNQQRQYVSDYLFQKKFICKKKNIEYNLDVNWYLEKLRLGCALTQISFDLNNYKKLHGPYSPYQPS